MLKAWPAVRALLVCALSCGYGKWRRGRGSPAQIRQLIWLVLLLPVICLPALALPSVLVSSALTPSDRATAVHASIAIGAVPLAVGLCFAGAMRLVRLYIARARSTAGARPNGAPMIYRRPETPRFTPGAGASRIP